MENDPENLAQNHKKQFFQRHIRDQNLRGSIFELKESLIAETKLRKHRKKQE
jgi:hypothetical protein